MKDSSTAYKWNIISLHWVTWKIMAPIYCLKGTKSPSFLFFSWNPLCIRLRLHRRPNAAGTEPPAYGSCVFVFPSISSVNSVFLNRLWCQWAQEILVHFLVLSFVFASLPKEVIISHAPAHSDGKGREIRVHAQSSPLACFDWFANFYWVRKSQI